MTLNGVLGCSMEVLWSFLDSLEALWSSRVAMGDLVVSMKLWEALRSHMGLLRAVAEL